MAPVPEPAQGRTLLALLDRKPPHPVVETDNKCSSTGDEIPDHDVCDDELFSMVVQLDEVLCDPTPFLDDEDKQAILASVQHFAY